MPEQTSGKSRKNHASRNKATSNKDVEVLATLLVAYPQISRAGFDPEKKSLGLVFLCRGPISAKKREELSRIYEDSVQVYLSLIGKQASLIKSSWEKMGNLYSFQVERDVESLSTGEITLTVELVSDRTRVVSASEGSQVADGADEASWSARLFLQDALDQVKNLDAPRKLVAFREGERVLVFDK